MFKRQYRSKDTASIVHSIHHHVRERTNQEQGNPFSSDDFCFYKLTLVIVPSHNNFLATKLVMSVRGLALLSRHDLWEGQEKDMVAASSTYQEHPQWKSTNTFRTHSSTRATFLGEPEIIKCRSFSASYLLVFYISSELLSVVKG